MNNLLQYFVSILFIITLISCSDEFSYDNTIEMLNDECDIESMLLQVHQKGQFPELIIKNMPPGSHFATELDSITDLYTKKFMPMSQYVDYQKQHKLFVTNYGVTPAIYTEAKIGSKSYPIALIDDESHPDYGSHGQPGEQHYPYVNLYGIDDFTTQSGRIFYARLASVIWMNAQTNTAPIVNREMLESATAIEATILLDSFYDNKMHLIINEFARKEHGRTGRNEFIFQFILEMTDEMQDFLREQTYIFINGKATIEDVVTAFKSEINEEVRLSTIRAYVESHFPTRYDLTRAAHYGT